MNTNQPLSVGVRYFQIQPLNNITSYEFGSGQDVIRFLIPAQANTLLQDLTFSATVNFDETTATAYVPDDITDSSATSKEFSMDSVAGAHALFQKVEVFSRRGNLLLESNQFYDQTAKLKEASYHSARDLCVGTPNCMNIQSSTSAGTMSRLTRTQGKAGVPISMRFDLGVLSDSDQKIMLDKVGGLEIVVHLSSTKNALFNLNNNNVQALDDTASISLQNVEIFGRYKMVNPAMAAQFNQVNFTEMSNNLQVLQSSRDTIGFTPQVAQLDSVLFVSQPNSDTRNNFESDGQAINVLVGQQEYKAAKNGLAFPFDWGFVKTKTALPNIPSTATISVGSFGWSAEPTFMNCIATQNRYPMAHSCLSAENLSLSNRGLIDNTNYMTANYSPIGISYKYGFEGYSTNFSNDLLQIEIASSIKTSDAHVPTTKSQTNTMNSFMKYKSVLDYASLQVSR